MFRKKKANQTCLKNRYLGAGRGGGVTCEEEVDVDGMGGSVNRVLKPQDVDVEEGEG